MSHILSLNLNRNKSQDSNQDVQETMNLNLKKKIAKDENNTVTTKHHKFCYTGDIN